MLPGMTGMMTNGTSRSDVHNEAGPSLDPLGRFANRLQHGACARMCA